MKRFGKFLLLCLAALAVFCLLFRRSAADDAAEGYRVYDDFE